VLHEILIFSCLAFLLASCLNRFTKSVPAKIDADLRLGIVPDNLTFLPAAVRGKAARLMEAVRLLLVMSLAARAQ
jgi:hypothetical protein